MLLLLGVPAFELQVAAYRFARDTRICPDLWTTNEREAVNSVFKLPPPATTKDVQVDPSGAIVEVEEEAAMDSLPASVKAGLTAKAAGGKILKVESITKNGKLVAYEAKLETAGKKSEIQVGPDGKPLDHEE